MARVRDLIPNYELSPKGVVLASGTATALAVFVALFARDLTVLNQGGWKSLAAKGSIIFAAFLLNGLVTYSTTYRQILRVRRQREWLHADIILGRLQHIYQEEIADVHVRANVMRVDSYDEPNPEREHREYVSIWEEAGDYSQAEWDCKYEPGEGCAGTAFQERQLVVYDANKPRGPSKRMTEEQQAATEKVNSALSVPIHPNNDPSKKPIGVLNLDSHDDISETNFNSEAAQSIAMKYAGTIGDVIS